MIKTELFFFAVLSTLKEIQQPAIISLLKRALTNAFCNARLKTIHRGWNAPQA